MADWLPMDMAPKDGTPIIAWDGKDRFLVEFVSFADGSGFWIVGESLEANGAPLTLMVARVLECWTPAPDRPETRSSVAPLG
jgi:hypothetical protein